MKIQLKTPWLYAACLLALGACTNSTNQNKTTDMTDSTEAVIPAKASFQSTIDGKKTDLFILKNKNSKLIK